MQTINKSNISLVEPVAIKGSPILRFHHTHLHPALLHFITFLFLLAPCRIVLSATRSIAMHASSTASHLPNKNTDTIFGLGDDKETDRTPSNVHGWLMNVHGYREPSEPYDNNMRYLISGCRGVNARCT